MFAYDPSEWSDLFVATAGASAALLGLLFVAVSINLERILGFQGLPERALETLMLLLGVLVASIAGLVPGQSALALGLELLALGLAMAAGAARLPVTYAADSGAGSIGWRLGRHGVRAASIGPILVAGITLVLEGGGGLYWLAAGIAFSIFGAVVGAWVLLVEILR